MKVLLLGSGQGPGQGAGYFMAKNCYNGWLALGVTVVPLGLEEPKELRYIVNAVEDHKPDLVFQLLAQHYGHIPQLLQVDRKGTPVVLWNMTEEEDQNFCLSFSNKIALYCTYTQKAVSVHKNNGANVIFLPTAADDSIFKPIEPAPEYQKDIVYIGYPFDFKINILNKLGQHFKDRCFFKLGGETPQSEENKYYNSSKVIIESGQHQDLIAGWGQAGCPCRIYEVGASGGFQIVMERPDLKAVYEPNREIATYDRSIDNLIEKIEYYLDSEQEREEIRKKYHQRTIREHLYKHRFKRVLKEKGFES